MPEPHVCIHFGTCGGCTYQNLSQADYRALKREMVVRALQRQRFENPDVTDVVAVAPGTRRRAVFKIAKQNGEVLAGFHAAKSHAIVDMRECRVLTPGLYGLVAGLRGMMGAILRDGENAEAHATQADNGFDIALRWERKFDPETAAEVARWMKRLDLARVTANGEILCELAAPEIAFAGARIRIPPDCFLQPTREGEGVLQSFVLESLKNAKSVADLFCGIGTFALPLARLVRVQAFDSDRAMVAALSVAARNAPGLKPLAAQARDLFRDPLPPDEWKRFDAAVLDPPRAGALAQVRALAQSSVRRIAYVSCNADTFARDARVLAEGGYEMGTVTPVDQFLWSEHIELVAAFAR